MAPEGDRRKSAPKGPDPFRFLGEFGLQAATAARSLAEEFARTATNRAPRPVVQVASEVLQLATMWVTPVQAMLQEQTDFLELMGQWADNQREFAARMEKLVETNRRMTAELNGLLGPFIEQTEALRNYVAQVRDEAADRPAGDG